MKPLILIAHNKVGVNSSVDEQDVVLQIEAISAALLRLGFAVDTVALTLDLTHARRSISERNPYGIFNLVESLDGDDRFASAATLLFESLHIPFTGSRSVAMIVTSDKCAAKKIMDSAFIPTPRWHIIDAQMGSPAFFPCIVKTATDHASKGITDVSVINNKEAWERMRTLSHGKEMKGMFAEAYVHGREFNVSIIDDASSSPKVLPCAEIHFRDFPEGKPHIVGYSAKWEKESFEYRHTERLFPKDHNDDQLKEELASLALDCWSLFSLSGYARVDFRVSDDNKVNILEVNTNPCLSPDAGFYAACKEAGMTYEAMVNAIINAAISIPLVSAST